MYHRYRESAIDEVEGTDEYEYVTEDPKGSPKTGLAAQQSMEVTHYPPVTSYHYPGSPREPGTDVARTDYFESQYTDEPKLFGMAHDPGISMVTYMEGTERAKAIAPTMLGLAQLKTFRERGRFLQAPDDLSEHSVRMVKKLQEKGSIPTDELMRPTVTNQMDFRDPYPNWRPDAYAGRRPAMDRVPGEDVRLGQKIGRAVIQGHTPQDLLRPPAEPEPEEQTDRKWRLFDPDEEIR